MGQTLIRTGICNMCGECCGYPRKTDGQSTNAWPAGLQRIYKHWSKEAIAQHQLLGRITEEDSIAVVDGKGFSYRWKDNGELCAPNGEQCPFLIMEGDQHPCGLYNSSWHNIWQDICRNAPSEELELLEVKLFFEKCPSCSYEYVEK